MPESDYIRKHAVMCLRLAAECRDLAAGVATPELRARVLRMADMWEDLADQPPARTRPMIRDHANETPPRGHSQAGFGTIPGPLVTAPRMSDLPSLAS